MGLYDLLTTKEMSFPDSVGCPREHEAHLWTHSATMPSHGHKLWKIWVGVLAVGCPALYLGSLSL